MRLATSILFVLCWTACGQKAPRDFSSAIGAARTFVEAGRLGDMDGVRAAVVAAERNQDLQIDYSDLCDYQLAFDRELDDEHAVVSLQIGALATPLACVREADGWRVSLHGSLALMSEQLQAMQAAPPR